MLAPVTIPGKLPGMANYPPNRKIAAYWSDLFHLSSEYWEISRFVFSRKTLGRLGAGIALAVVDHVMLTILLVGWWLVLLPATPFLYGYWVLDWQARKHDSLGSP